MSAAGPRPWPADSAWLSAATWMSSVRISVTVPRRPDVGAAHDVQRRGGRLAAGQAVRQVGQPVEVKAPAEQGQQPDREPGRGQRAGPSG